MASAMARAAVRLPSQHTITRSSLSRLLLDIGHDDDRPPGFEQRASIMSSSEAPSSRLRLPDDREVEASRDLAEQVGAAATLASSSARLDRNPRRLGRRRRTAQPRPSRSLLFSSRWASIKSIGMPPSMPSGITGS